MDNFFDDINSAIKVLKEGGLILYPTDTIWGVGCDATNEAAVEKIYDLKKRKDSKSMLVLVDSIDKIYDYIQKVPRIAIDIAEISDKPTTVIYPGAVGLAENLIAEDKSIGIRVANDKFCQALIRKYKKPIVSTSANVSSEKTPMIFFEISDEIKKNVDYIVKWRQDDKTKSKPSSIIKIGLSGEVKIVRE